MMLTYERMQKERARLLDAGLRTWGNGDLDRDTALHEGAHVLVAHLLHLNPTRATIEPGLGYAGMTSLGRASARAEAVAVCLAAGDEAEAPLAVPVLVETIRRKCARCSGHITNRLRLRTKSPPLDAPRACCFETILAPSSRSPLNWSTSAR
jgi:hypothetical protein